jgi:hypothetical protein
MHSCAKRARYSNNARRKRQQALLSSAHPKAPKAIGSAMSWDVRQHHSRFISFQTTAHAPL